VRDRVSRIDFVKRFFHYPRSLNLAIFFTMDLCAPCGPDFSACGSVWPRARAFCPEHDIWKIHAENEYHEEKQEKQVFLMALTGLRYKGRGRAGRLACGKDFKKHPRGLCPWVACHF